MNFNIINALFFFICLFLIFNNIPEILQVNFISGPLYGKLVFFPCVLGIVYTLYFQYKYKIILVNFNKIIDFLLLYFSIIFISIIIGLYNYPYYDLVMNGPMLQIEKFSKIITFIKSLGLDIDLRLIMPFWVIVRSLKEVILEILFAFGGAYIIYCWYHNNWKIAFDIMIKAVIVSLIFIFSYSIIEIFYLGGNQTAKKILEFITPYFHIVKVNDTWWPPLLWKNQLRSLFAEPSYYGIYFAFAMPFLWYLSYTIKKYSNMILLYTGMIFFSFCLFITQARTAVVLFLGEIGLFIILLMILKNKWLLKNFAIIGVCNILAFGMSNVFIANFIQTNSVKIIVTEVSKDMSNKSVTKNNIVIPQKFNNQKVNQEGNKFIVGKTQINSYFENNLFSLLSLNKRSNNARYSIMLTDLKIGMDSPILGVGKGLRNAYVPDYLPDMAKGNREVKMWLTNQTEKGIMRSGFPKLGEYTNRFAETGILGLIMFLIPPFILLKKLYLKITDKTLNADEKLPYVFFTISLIGIMASGIGDTINITYCYWVLLGLGYAMCFSKENNNNLVSNKNNE